MWTSAQPLHQPLWAEPVNGPSIAAGDCFDFYFNIVITRTSLAHHTARRFRIDVTADALGAVSTPAPRELYVEELVSQNRNSVASITGPTDVAVGSTYTYVLTADTPTGGYWTAVVVPQPPNAVFQILSVDSTYTTPAGGTNDTIYARWLRLAAGPDLPGTVAVSAPATIREASAERWSRPTR